MNKEYIDDHNGPMLNAYPDSIGGKMEGMVDFLDSPQLKETFQSIYILPSLFHSDLDRGFSIIDYDLEERYTTTADLERLKTNKIDMKLDFVLNHLSVLSAPFQDMITNGENSKYKDFFIPWNQFWEGCGSMCEAGYIQPEAHYLAPMFFRKPGLPILMVRFPDGKEVPYWNTFYQEVSYPIIHVPETMERLSVQYGVATALTSLVNKELAKGVAPTAIDFSQLGEVGEKYGEKMRDFIASKRSYRGQMDVNIQSPLVWEYYDQVLAKLASYGAKVVRLDAFAYAPKAPGEKNFLNEPTTWEVLERVAKLAQRYGLTLLPEIHATYAEKIHEKVAQKGYMTYDFFLPGLMIDALERKSADRLVAWANEIVTKGMRTVNMLGCHDGIPLLDLKGLMPEEEIQALIDTVVARGGYVKALHGQKNMYYQVNATYYSALGEDDGKMLLARALQLFMPGKPQIWYLDLLVGKNDYEAVERAGAGGHKEINRTNLTCEEVEKGMQLDVVQRQLEMIRFRHTCPAFGWDATFEGKVDGSKVTMTWERHGHQATLQADLGSGAFTIGYQQKNKNH